MPNPLDSNPGNVVSYILCLQILYAILIYSSHQLHAWIVYILMYLRQAYIYSPVGCICPIYVTGGDIDVSVTIYIQVIRLVAS